MNTFRTRDLLRLAAFSLIMFGALSCGGEQTQDEGEAGETLEATPVANADGPCLAPPNWFPHDKTPKPNDSVVFTENCQFHQWSWQMFLWLTQTTGNELRFESFARPTDLFSPSQAAPADFASLGANRMLKLNPRTTKTDDPTMLDEINQAGSDGLLIDQNGRAVYYSMYINDVFYNFVKENNLYDPTALAAFSDSTDFPIGALELKVAWKVVGPNDNTQGMYTRKAEISKLVEKNGTVVIDPTQVEQVTVAMVGFHIAGVTAGHPEFIWATFEHNRNSPTLTDEQLKAYLDVNNNTINNEVVSDTDWTFFKAGSTFIQSNQNNAGKVKITDPNAQTLTPVTNAFLQYAQGGGVQSNRDHIKELNASVLEQLKDPIFSNYYLGGAIWLKEPNALVPNSTQQDLITGSTDLSNVTLETFTQKVNTERNCFSCHNTMQRFPPNPGTGVDPLPGKNVSVSHILVNNYFQRSERAKAGN